MTNYSDTFEVRGDSYVDAHALAPRARDQERRLLLDRLRLEKARRVCDMPSGGGFVADGLAAQHETRLRDGELEIVCVEPSSAFARRIDPRHEVIEAEMVDTGLPAASADRIASLAGLHHFDDKLPFFIEANRILCPGGIICVADVRAHTPVAAFLNDTVDRYTETGHDGMFFAAGEMAALLDAAGFVNVKETFEEFHWVFPSPDVMVAFCKTLFGLVKASPAEVDRELRRHFDIVETPDAVRLPWSLVYAVGEKPV